MNKTSITYPAQLTPDGNGWMVSFPDMPEALTSGHSEKQAMDMAQDALNTALDFYFEERRSLEASGAERDEVFTQPLKIGR